MHVMFTMPRVLLSFPLELNVDDERPKGHTHKSTLSSYLA